MEKITDQMNRFPHPGLRYGAGASSTVPLENLRTMIGIDISSTACRVMAKRLRDVCGLPESKPHWHAGRGFVVREAW
jgi:hypothetical protein